MDEMRAIVSTVQALAIRYGANVAVSGNETVGFFVTLQVVAPMLPRNETTVRGQTAEEVTTQLEAATAEWPEVPEDVQRTSVLAPVSSLLGALFGGMARMTPRSRCGACYHFARHERDSEGVLRCTRCGMPWRVCPPK